MKNEKKNEKQKKMKTKKKKKILKPERVRVALIEEAKLEFDSPLWYFF